MQDELELWRSKTRKSFEPAAGARQSFVISRFSTRWALVHLFSVRARTQSHRLDQTRGMGDGAADRKGRNDGNVARIPLLGRGGGASRHRCSLVGAGCGGQAAESEHDSGAASNSEGEPVVSTVTSSTSTTTAGWGDTSICTLDTTRTRTGSLRQVTFTGVSRPARQLLSREPRVELRLLEPNLPDEATGDYSSACLDASDWCAGGASRSAVEHPVSCLWGRFGP